MTELLVQAIDNANDKLVKMPEFEGCQLWVRADGNAITTKTLPPGHQLAIIKVGMDNPTTEESIVILTKDHVYNTQDVLPDMVLSLLTQVAFADLVTFAVGQTITMHRRAKLMELDLVDKPVESE